MQATAVFPHPVLKRDLPRRVLFLRVRGTRRSCHVRMQAFRGRTDAAFVHALLRVGQHAVFEVSRGHMRGGWAQCTLCNAHTHIAEHIHIPQNTHVHTHTSDSFSRILSLYWSCVLVRSRRRLLPNSLATSSSGSIPCATPGTCIQAVCVYAGGGHGKHHCIDTHLCQSDWQLDQASPPPETPVCLLHNGRATLIVHCMC